MDTVISKFYSNGINDASNFNQFGGLTSSKILASQQPKVDDQPFKTMNLLNPAVHKSQEIPKKQGSLTQADFLRPPNLMFNSTSDLLYNNILPRQNGNTSSYKQMKEDELAIDKKNITKMHMMEEKMKNLELKSQRLEVINDFFFDMFENNLVREELNRQREEKAKKLEEEKSDVDSDSDIFYGKKKSKRSKKAESARKDRDRGKLNLNKYDDTKPEYDPQEFQARTVEHAREVLKSLKEGIGNFLVEEQLKKNEELQSMTEDIIEMKSTLLNKLDRIQLRQRQQMEKIAFCLQNSGNKKIENLASRLLQGEYFDYQQMDALNFGETKSGIRRGSILTKSQGEASKHRKSIVSGHRKSIAGERKSILGEHRKSVAGEHRKSVVGGHRKSIASGQRKSIKSTKFMDEIQGSVKHTKRNSLIHPDKVIKEDIEEEE